MNFLTLMTLVVLVPSADPENADTWVRVTAENIEVATTSEGGEALQQKGSEGILVKCKSLKITFTGEGKTIECEGCSFSTGTGLKGTAHSVVFDQGKGTITLKGDETTPVEIISQASKENGELKFVSESMQITMLPPNMPSDPRNAEPTDRPFGGRVVPSPRRVSAGEVIPIQIEVPNQKTPEADIKIKFVPDSGALPEPEGFFEPKTN